MSNLPEAAALELTRVDYEPVTEDADEVTETYFVANAETSRTDDGKIQLSYWYDGTARGMPLSGVERDGQSLTGHNEDGAAVHVRPVTARDAIVLSSAGVPQPVEVVEAEVLRGGGTMLAGELDAAVAADNSVATLVLDTGMGLFVRYSGAWQKVDDSGSLENLSIMPVSPKALPVYDAADAAGESLLIFDLPRSVGGEYTDVNDREDAASLVGEAVTAAVRVIENTEDLSNVALLPTDVSTAWYVEKRTQALMASGRETDAGKGVIATAQAYLDANLEGHRVDPNNAILRTIIASARKTGVLQHPVVMAAINWRSWLHPRGRDGRFIFKNGSINVYEGSTPEYGEVPKRGKVVDLTQDGVVVRFDDQSLGEQTVPADRIEAHNPLGQLKPTENPTEKVTSKGAEVFQRVKEAYRDLDAKFAKDAQENSANIATDDPLDDETYQAHAAFLDRVNGEITGQKLTMADLFKDDKGRWDDVFYEWMLDTVDEVYEAKYKDIPKDRKAIVTGGLGGAGKSTTLKRLAAAGVIEGPVEANYATINPDDMKEEMIARGMFPEITGMSPSEMANAMHEVSSTLSSLLEQRVLLEGHNIIEDITMGGGTKIRRDGRRGNKGHVVSDQLAAAGYDSIDGIFVDIPVERSIDQALGRHRGGLERFRARQSSEGGRYVPPFIIEENDYNPTGAKPWKHAKDPSGNPKKQNPNPLNFGIPKDVDYGDRYGTDDDSRLLADQAELLRTSIFTSTATNAAQVDTLLDDFEAKALASENDRAAQELDALRAEWEFMDPRTTGVDAATRFNSTNAYNFARAVHDGAITGDSVIFDNSDLDNPGTLSATGKFQNRDMRGAPYRPGGSDQDFGPFKADSIAQSDDWDDYLQEVANGLAVGDYELTVEPTSERDGEFILHLNMPHSDSVEGPNYLVFDNAESRDAALAHAQKIQEKGFKSRAPKSSALKDVSPEAKAVADQMPDAETRAALADNMEVVQTADGWIIQAKDTGQSIGEAGDRESVTALMNEALNAKFPPVGERRG